MDVHRVATTAFGDKRPPIDPVGVAEEEPLRGTSGQKYRVRRRTSPSRGTVSSVVSPIRRPHFGRPRKRARSAARCNTQQQRFGSRFGS